MKRVWIAAALIFIAPGALAGETGTTVSQRIEVPAQTVGPVTVGFQGSTLLRIREKIGGIALGSSQIANVNVHDAHTILISGQAYGSTTLHVLDTYGNILADTVVHVVDTSASRLTVTRAGQTYSMDCAPNCRAAPNIGDDSGYFDVVSKQVKALSGSAN
jgi:Flp pilus assembly secretin CpaC